MKPTRHGRKQTQSLLACSPSACSGGWRVFAFSLLLNKWNTWSVGLRSLGQLTWVTWNGQVTKLAAWCRRKTEPVCWESAELIFELSHTDDNVNNAVNWKVVSEPWFSDWSHDSFFTYFSYRHFRPWFTLCACLMITTERNTFTEAPGESCCTF